MKKTIALLILSIALSGCSNSALTGNNQVTSTPNNSVSQTEVSTPNTEASSSDKVATSSSDTSTIGTQITAQNQAKTVDIIAGIEAAIKSNKIFSDRDKTYKNNENTAISIDLADNASKSSSENVSIEGNTIKITKEGVYILKGELQNGQIVIDSDKTSKIQLVLNGVSINNDTSASIYVKQADKVFITLNSGSVNNLSNKLDFIQLDDNNINAVIYSKDDLAFNGLGTLNINAVYGHGISGKDDVIFTSGNYNIVSQKNGIDAKDCLKIADGNFDIKSQKDALHSENTDDSALGYIYIANGDFKIEAGDDGIHSSTVVIIEDGKIDIKKSYEGIEGQVVDIRGGIIDVVSSDDGLNAANPFTKVSGANPQQPKGNSSEVPIKSNLPDNPANTQNPRPNLPPTNGKMRGDRGGFGGGGMENDSNCYIKISGGILNIDAQADGIDSNGSLYVTGGETYVSGPTSSGNGALDYNGVGEIKGGIVVAAGANGMAQNFGTTSAQGSIMINTLPSTDKITLKDSSGKILCSFTPKKQYSSVVVSTPQIAINQSYNLSVGENVQKIDMTSLIYGVGGGMGGKRH